MSGFRPGSWRQCYLNFVETAQVLAVSVVTVKRDWTTARAWLYREARDSLA